MGGRKSTTTTATTKKLSSLSFPQTREGRREERKCVCLSVLGALPSGDAKRKKNIIYSKVQFFFLQKMNIDL